MSKSLMIDDEEYINKVLDSDSIIMVNKILKFELPFGEGEEFYIKNTKNKVRILYKDTNKLVFSGIIETVIIYCKLNRIEIFCIGGINHE